MRVSAMMLGALLLPVVPVAAAEEPPAPELLEFLGDWDDGNGNWVDPEMWQVATSDEEAQTNEGGKDD